MRQWSSGRLALVGLLVSVASSLILAVCLFIVFLSKQSVSPTYELFSVSQSTFDSSDNGATSSSSCNEICDVLAKEASLRSNIVDIKRTLNYAAEEASARTASAHAQNVESNSRRNDYIALTTILESSVSAEIASLTAIERTAKVARKTPPPNRKMVALNSPIRSLDFSGRGYDIFKGNPRDTTGKVDAGFRQPVVELSYKKGRFSGDGWYPLPDYVDVAFEPSTSFSSYVSTFTSSKTYSQQLDVSVKVQGSPPSGRFEKSLDFQRIENCTFQAGVSYVQLDGISVVYRASLLPGFGVTQAFQHAIAGLSDNATYERFVATYGTHYVAQVVMGGLAAQQRSMTTEEFVKFELTLAESGIDAATTYGPLTASQWMDVRQKLQGEGKSMTSSFTNVSIEWFMGGLAGTGAFTDGSPLALKKWASRVADNPAPVSYSLVDIPRLLTDIRLFPLESAETLANKRLKLTEYICFYSRNADCSTDIIEEPTTPVNNQLFFGSYFTLEYSLLAVLPEDTFFASIETVGPNRVFSIPLQHNAVLLQHKQQSNTPLSWSNNLRFVWSPLPLDMTNMAKAIQTKLAIFSGGSVVLTSEQNVLSYNATLLADTPTCNPDEAVHGCITDSPSGIPIVFRFVRFANYLACPSDNLSLIRHGDCVTLETPNQGFYAGMTIYSSRLETSIGPSSELVSNVYPLQDLLEDDDLGEVPPFFVVRLINSDELFPNRAALGFV